MDLFEITFRTGVSAAAWQKKSVLYPRSYGVCLVHGRI